MRSVRWNRKCAAFAAVGIMLFYILIRSGDRIYQIDTIIKNTKPETVWDYVADFSKMKLLNPTIIDFTITSDTGNYKQWQYSVVYNERLSHWPYLLNRIIGDISVWREKINGHEEFYIDSTHKTCFFKGLYCLKSIGQFKFKPFGKDDTYCLEKVQYQCPPFMAHFCQREVEFQRKAIMHNLTIHFHKKNI